MTGMLDGQNIVLIVIESGEWYGINSEYTPNAVCPGKPGRGDDELYHAR